MSHLDRPHLEKLLKDICLHGSNKSLIILDFLGRYSIEWPNYWNVETEEEKIRDYSMSYLYNESGEDVEVEHFPIRFWTGKGVEALVRKVSHETKIQIELLKKFDRSILVGRHTDTQQYNPTLKPLGFNNTYALMMRHNQASDINIKTISDLKDYVDKTGK